MIQCAANCVDKKLCSNAPRPGTSKGMDVAAHQHKLSDALVDDEAPRAPVRKGDKERNRTCDELAPRYLVSKRGRRFGGDQGLANLCAALDGDGAVALHVYSRLHRWDVFLP